MTNADRIAAALPQIKAAKELLQGIEEIAPEYVDELTEMYECLSYDLECIKRQCTGVCKHE